MSFLENTRKCMLILLLLFTGIQVLSAGDSYYVATNGSNANSGAFSTPWKSLAYAVTVATAGDTIFIRGGRYINHEVYVARTKGRGGRGGNYLTIKAYQNEQPIMDYGSRRLIVWADYVRIEGLHFIMPWRCDIFGKGNQVINNIFTGEQPQYGAIETGGVDVLIQGNYIQYDDEGGNTQDHGIYLHAGKNIVVRGNTVSGSKGYGIHLYDEQKSPNPDDWVANPFSMEGYLIEDNIVMYSQSRSGLIIAKGRGGNYIDLRDITVRNNVFFRNYEFGIYIREGEDIKVENNTFYSNRLAPVFIREPSPEGVETAENITVVNNILSAQPGMNHIFNSSYAQNIQLSNNLYNRTPMLVAVTPSTYVVGDPKFVNESTQIFLLQLDSPAIDAGLDIGLPFSGKAPDIGAFENAQGVTGISNSEEIPNGYSLQQNYPNPFNPDTKIPYQIAQSGKTLLEIFNMLGRRVRTLFDDNQSAGSHVVFWDGRDQNGQQLASGVYFYRLTVQVDGQKKYRMVRRMALLK